MLEAARESSPLVTFFRVFHPARLCCRWCAVHKATKASRIIFLFFPKPPETVEREKLTFFVVSTVAVAMDMAHTHPHSHTCVSRLFAIKIDSR